MKTLTWQKPGQQNVAQELIKIIINYVAELRFRKIQKGTIQVFTCKKLLMTKKKLPVRFTGQHFTIDKVLIKDAIRQANISNQDTVLDIGAGKGFLTVHLSLNPQLHSRSATYIKRNGLLIRKITIKSSRPFQCAYHPLTP
ncbi:rRNA adenine N-6-methyltransferase family protein [Phocaeicola coprocola DSM 17136]|uniref:rRNA adenine N-6-methyltransferase family protein n=1 Tax=Phocaeicola coprocola DSM 17136 TaxID=470145 RepID=B3JDZ6_9BACT|nr:rRNA adenine N-6-methyltransferase family protein [Phocaeicola coprocola DSM 17136]EDV02815.1 rRNA adenine N-6-methyltransferase family protein [Phocaeicola coprocola DSM 17136]